VSQRPFSHEAERYQLTLLDLTALEFWQPYVEEWKVPPFDRAKRSAERQSFYKKLASPIFRMLVLRGELTSGRKSALPLTDLSTANSTPHSFVFHSGSRTVRYELD